MKFQAAIFDMDGLLLDTERVCMHVFRQACSTVNLPFYEDVYLSIIGRNSVGIEKIFRQAYGNNLDKLHLEWRRNYDAIVKHQPIPVKEGVVELLNWLRTNKIPTAVATSTQRDVAEIKLQLAGIDTFFDGLTCGCEVSNGKPDPEIYLLAAKRLGVDAKHCLAFEDSNNGVRSAIAAQMTTFQIPDLVEPCEEIKALGHTILPSLKDVLNVLNLHS
ncbi:phosphatase [Vibrio zhanjiangensis]|uniref:Phosphatase n=1 Tax=Vibrio zhanjiangensis TaxID=1046128 RepID=A0ABQ6EW01_9VIBR|nr:HAD family phosphatase [Vibrio zhanjiangensis]GLT16984.1 phosphatase [Vibrio zhanjiangensis]